MNKAASEYIALPATDMAQIVDLRDLEAPEPMEKILSACTRLGPDEKYLAHLPHLPAPLFPQLETRGLNWQVFEQEDGSAIVLIRRRA